MNKVEIQHAETSQANSGAYDVLVNGDHYHRYYSHAEACEGAVRAMVESNGMATIKDHTRANT